MTQEKILGRWDSIAISIGIVIGVGIFEVPQQIASFLDSGALILLAWLVGGLFSFAGALLYAELSSIYPTSGGDYIYLRECYGKCTAFLFAWSELLITRTGSVAAIALIFGKYTASLIDANLETIEKPLAIGIVIALTLSNLFGLKTGSRLQNLFTLLKVLALFIIFVAGVFLFSKFPSQTNFFAGPQDALKNGLFIAFTTSLVPILWTYGGWRDNVFLAGETKDAKKNLPFALLITCLTITLIYVILNFLYLYYVPLEKIAQSHFVATDLCLAIFGEGGAKFLASLIVIFCFGAINALILTGSRIAHAMANDNRFFGFLSIVDQRTNTPRRSILFNGIWACVLIYLIGKFENLLFFTGLAVWIFFGLTAICVMVLRRRTELDPDQFITPLYPAIPLLVAFVSLLLAISTFLEYPNESIQGSIIVLAGIPVYYLQKIKFAPANK